jgi:hypothetical protein
LSTDGKWHSFPKVPHLLQYVISGNYFGKVKINGSSIRKSLQATVWTTAQLRLNDFLKEHWENRNRVDPPKFSEAVELSKRELEHDTTIKQQSKEYRLWCLGKLQETWPELWDLRLDEITPKACKAWAVKLVREFSCHYYNNTLSTLKQVLQTGIKAHKANGAQGQEPIRIALPGQDRFHDLDPAHPDQAADHVVELHIHPLQRLLLMLHAGRRAAQMIGPQPQVVLQTPNLGRWHKARLVVGT